MLHILKISFVDYIFRTMYDIIAYVTHTHPDSALMLVAFH